MIIIGESAVPNLPRILIMEYTVDSTRAQEESNVVVVSAKTEIQSSIGEIASLRSQ